MNTVHSLPDMIGVNSELYYVFFRSYCCIVYKQHSIAFALFKASIVYGATAATGSHHSTKQS
jgi:hypothetical protein